MKTTKSMARELSAHFPHVAMSIPYVLGSQCIGFIEQMHAQYLAGFMVTINNLVQLQVTLCMCCSGPVDISKAGPAAEENAGELEMF